LWLAAGVHRRLPFLDRFLIPKPITGGVLLAAMLTALRTLGVEVEFDTVLRDLLMLTFFTTVGLRASAELLRRESGMMVICLLLGAVGALLQNVSGVAGARLFGLHPLTGIVAGATTLAGGPATALAFGQTFEKMGLADAATLGVGCAVFGILAAGFVGGAVGGYLIRRDGLSAAVTMVAGPSMVDERKGDIWFTLGALVVCLGLGSLLSRGIASIGWTLPAYIGSMIVAAGVRYWDDRTHRRLDESVLRVTATWSVGLFIVIALLTLKLWVLAQLALPLLAILTMQVLLTSLFAVVVAYRLLGRDYDAAVTTAGWVGFMLGTTANTVACIDVLEARHGPSGRARLVAPVTGGFLIDFTNALVILWSADIARRFW
jgi:ESS family glutamate:Na+ symporter